MWQVQVDARHHPFVRQVQSLNAMSPSHAELQSVPADDRLTAVAEAVLPGSPVVSVSRLKGGQYNGMHVLELRTSGRRNQQVVLRRFGGEGDSPAVDAFQEWHVLRMLRELGIAAPDPLFLDADGSVSGYPAIVISFVDGEPLLRPSDASDWTGQVARALWELHSADIDQVDVSFLGPAKNIAEIAATQCARTERFIGHPLGQRLRSAMLEAIADVSPAVSTVVHGDYWPGNILWHEGRLLVLVDWNDARMGDPATDVGQMWMDLTLLGEHAAAEEFCERYERLNGCPVQNLRLARLQALSGAMPDPGTWMPGWTGLGRTDLTVEDVRRNFSQMIELLTR